MTLMGRARAHVDSLSPRGALWPLAPFLAYAAYSLARSDLRFDHLAVIGIVATLAYVGPRTKELLVTLYPVGLVFLLYDAMRPFQTATLSESRVLLCGLRDLEASLFGAGGRTLHDYFLTHHHPVLDVLCAVPYATFIVWCLGGAVVLHMRDRAASRRYMWGFLLLNVAGFVTYHALPAAPPWYFHANGCVVDLSAKASEGPALARVDAMLGVSYFRGMYSKASSVFGALPSLHCAYPLLLAIEGWRSFGPKLRTAAVAYSAAMVFSAVYLDHHWLLDAILGALYAVLAAVAMRGILRLRAGARGAAPVIGASALRPSDR